MCNLREFASANERHLDSSALGRWIPRPVPSRGSPKLTVGSNWCIDSSITFLRCQNYQKDNVKLTFCHLGASLAHLGANLADLGAKLAHLGSILEGLKGLADSHMWEA